MRAEIFGLPQFESHAKAVASGHVVESGPGRERLLRRLDENESIIRESHDAVVEAVRGGRLVAPAAEWLLDNYYLVRQQIGLAREHLPPGYSRELPRLRSGPNRGMPRVYDLAMELVSHTDGRVDAENVTHFVRAYQSVRPLSLGELWALPAMLRLALMENLRRVAYRISWRRRLRDLATEWAHRFLRVAQDDPDLVITELADFVRFKPPVFAPFVAELAGNIEGVHPSLGTVIHWVEQKLAERGQTIQMIQQAESQEQAADQLSIGNSITSLRTLGAIDWRDFVESLSVTEAVLRRDPSGTYPLMDFRTRDVYRHVVEGLAKRSRRPEEEVAALAIRLAADRRRQASTEQRESHVGYFLVDRGRREFERETGFRAPVRVRAARLLARRPLVSYLLAVTAAAVLLAAAPALAAKGLALGEWGWVAALAVVTFAAVSRPAVSLVNWAITLLVPSKHMPRLDFSEGIPAEHRTAVVVPVLLHSAKDAAALMEHLEVRYLANRSPNLLFALLSDFTDAPEERMPDDGAVLDSARFRLRELNREYAADGESIFFLLHRPRRWNPGEGVWMGYERKRGKLEAFNRLVREGDARAFTVIEGDVEALRCVKYVITLDSDTELPPESAWKLVGSMAHPLNRPAIDPAARRVEKGYGVLQPRVGINLVGARQSLFARLFAGDVGIDPYTREVANVYQDVFGGGRFVGKGIYDVGAFQLTAGDRFPENRILSHDLIEGGHARCGFVNDVELLEDQPSAYLSDVSRRHRWCRGDWQIARWLLPSVPDAQGRHVHNPLGPLAKWMIFDNLRRSLVPLAWMTALLLGWFAMPDRAVPWTTLLLAVFFAPDAARTVFALSAKGKHIAWSSHLRRASAKELRLWAIDALTLVFLPFECAVNLDAIARTLWRLWVSRRRLLEWRTASVVNRAASVRWTAILGEMWPAPLLAAATVTAAFLAEMKGSGPLTASGGLTPLLPAAGVLALWLVSPFVAWVLSRPRGVRRSRLVPRQTLFLRKLARRTWTYFERFVTPESHWLPADNFQEEPRPRTAGRTSPTNIGMALLSSLAAFDFGYLTAGRLIERTDRTFATMGRLDRYRGHFYNWYNTETLEPLHPLYVSTVDSGNLSGLLLTLKAGLQELASGPVLSERWREGLEDTAGVLLEELERARRQDGAKVVPSGLETAEKALCEVLAGLGGVPRRLPEILRAVRRCESCLAALGDALEGREGPAFWVETMREQCSDLRQDVLGMAPWLGHEGLTEALSRESPDGPAAQFISVPRLDELASLETRVSSRLNQLAAGLKLDEDARRCLKRHVAAAAEWASARIRKMQDLATGCEELADNDLDFLLDSSRELLSLGFNLDAHRRDSGEYDLLASEARLCSFVGVSLGQLPIEHWFHLGRQLVWGDGHPVLVSWSGSLFEYLMPLLVMPSYEGTLLNDACKAAIGHQIRWGREQQVPWGFSESCYYQFDSQMTYQYRAFGVPRLGLKRGLSDDLVVAPYAAAMALVLSPREACNNLERLSRLDTVGRFGLYEAVDYTRSRLQGGKPYVVVRTYMAHHSGMTLLALVHVLAGRPMQRRFMSDPRFQASAVLLQERVPLARPWASAGGEVSEGDGRGRTPQAREVPSRSYTSPATATPELQLLSNGRYHVMVTNAGGGYSRWQDLALTRWREDETRDHWGTFLYVTDVDSGKTCSAAHQPLCGEADRYHVVFSQGMAEFRSIHETLELQTQVAVSTEDDVEVRRVVLSNLSDRVRTVELTSYAEVVLLDARMEAAHPAFQGLFVESEIVAQKGAVLFTRRPRSDEERFPCLFHTMAAREAPVGHNMSFETDRSRFIGRGRSARNPAALDRPGPLSGTAGFVIDAIASIRYRLHLRPRESVTVDCVMGVGKTREEAMTLVDKYHDHRLAERVFELAWTHSQVLLHQIRATEADAQLFGRLAGSLLYANARLRTGSSVILRNRRGQSALWSYGVSGDLPIVLLRINDQSGLELVRQMIQAHAYWSHKGLRVDLVIWAEAHAGYRQSLLDAIRGMVQGVESKVLDQPGGIFVRNIDQIPEDDRAMFQAVARVVLSSLSGTLAEQVGRRTQRRPGMPALDPGRAPEASLPQEKGVLRRDLVFFNGLGGFTPDGREYVCLLSPDATTPAPWVNVLANPSFGTVVSESGGSYTWCENAHEFRLTPWYNDPVSDTSGEAFYIRDEETGSFWSPTPLPASGTTPYVCRHGLGYSVFEHSQERLYSEMTVYVAAERPVKLTQITLRNLSDRTRRLSVTGYCEWVLGEDRTRQAMHVVTRLDPQTGAIFAWNAFNYDFPGRMAFFHTSRTDRSLTADRTEFIGRNGTLASPDAMTRRCLSNRVGAGLDPCAAVQTYLEIPPGEQRQVVFVLGSAGSEQEAHSLLLEVGGLDGAQAALEAVWELWKRQLGGVYVETPNRSVDFLVNHWLLYQVLSARFWGRSGYYQSGGAFGFRDQLQDSLAFLYECPWLTRRHLLLCAAHQFKEGDVQHWWHPPSGRGVRSRISDNRLWLPYAVFRYVETTGDTGVLDEKAPFLEARPLNPDEESYYDLPQTTEEQATLYEHCVRAITRSLQFGSHGLPLMEGGDWNDAMNRVGRVGRGESVWLAFFLYDVLKGFARVASRRGDEAQARQCRSVMDRLKSSIEANAWDGRWYLRAFFDDGTPLGSSRNPECQIDLLPQSWAVLSGAADAERGAACMRSVLDRLVDSDLGLVKLLSPPFDAAPWDPGYIRGYVPGVRENGGQYTHAAIWTAMALAELHESEQAWRLFGFLNPIRCTGTAKRTSVYRVEPYVVAADVYAATGQEGRGGWTWYTGSAGWMYQLLVEKLLGLKTEADELSLSPLFPSGWSEYKIHYRYRETFYHIRIVKVGPETWKVRRLVVDKVEQPDLRIRLSDDRQEHFADVEVG